MKIKKLISFLLVILIFISAFSVMAFADNEIVPALEEISPYYTLVSCSGEALVKGSNVNLRSGPGTTYAVINKGNSSYFLQNNNGLILLGYCDNADSYRWYQVRVTSGVLAGEVGYIRSDLLTIVNSGASIDPIVS